MQQTSSAIQNNRQRKMALALPLLVLPFLTLGFWALGGGKASAAAANEIDTSRGLNLQVPIAQIKEQGPLDKMRYYEIADTDSLKTREDAKNDAWLHLDNHASPDTAGLPETRIYKKLAQINEALDNKVPDFEPHPAPKYPEANYTAAAPASLANEQLEKMLQSLHEKDTVADPDMQQINALLDKIMDIQHPERFNSASPSPAGAVLQPALAVTLADTIETGFFSLEDPDTSASTNAIEAILPETQSLTDAATVQLRLLTDLIIGGARIPRNNAIYGRASLQGERLTIIINSIRNGNALLPVSLSVYDMDGIEGIYIPGMPSGETTRQSSSNALQSIGLGSIDPSIGAQAASVGIETAKNLLRNKIKQANVTVKAGYRVLLRDKHTINN